MVTTQEARLQRAVLAFISTGLAFMLLPGTFLGVWNLVSISSRRQLEGLSAAWLQAHGHAQIYGWIGTFVIGIGFHSLMKMGRLPSYAVRRAWLSYGLWTTGVIIRWTANVTAWEWRIALPLSAVLELSGFITFFLTVSRHKPADANVAKKKPETWMLVVVNATLGFLFALLLNLVAGCITAWTSSQPALSPTLDQRLLAVPVWTFLVPVVWGFNARWLPVFLGLRQPDGRRLLIASAIAWIGVLFGLCGELLIAAILLLAAVGTAILGIRIFERSERPANLAGVHPTFPLFIRGAYVWLAIAAILTVWAAAADHNGGIWGASRHAVTVGFLAAMVFAIGQKILPSFCVHRLLFSKRAMFASLALLNIGCTLRVFSEIPAYEGFACAQLFWRLLSVSALTELTAVTVFAANLAATFLLTSRSEIWLDVTKVTAIGGIQN